MCQASAEDSGASQGEAQPSRAYWNLLCSSKLALAIWENYMDTGGPFDQDYNGLQQSAAKAASIMSTPDSMSLSPGPRRDRYRWLTTNMRRNLRRNIAVANYEGMPTSSSSFALFQMFPPEIRCRIWRHALHTPRIVELEVLPSSHQEPWMLQYWPKNPPPLLITCQESRREAIIVRDLDAPRNLRNGVMGTKWMRYDWDIAYLKDFKFYRPWRIDYPDWRRFTLDCFRYIEALIISRRLLRLRCYDLAETDFFCCAFPRLRVLFILLGDKDQLHSLSNVLDGENRFHLRELARSKWGQKLVKLSMGPFGKAHGVDKNSVEEDIREALCLTQAENLRGTFTAPSIIGRSYSLPESIKSLLSATPWPDLDSEYEDWVRSESSDSSSSEE